jgi:hypothetical protein
VNGRRSLALALVIAGASGCSASETSSPAATGPDQARAPSASASLPPAPRFTTSLLEPGDAAEPAIAIGQDGAIAVTAGEFGHVSIADFHTKVWLGNGGTPLELAGVIGPFDVSDRVAIPSRDSDVDISTTGTLHITTNVRLYPPDTTVPPLGPSPEAVIAAVRCPNPAHPEFEVRKCSTHMLGRDPGAKLDRQWIVSNGDDVWLTYHDQALNIIVFHSADDGLHWRRTGAIFPGDSDVAADNRQGPIVVDPIAGDLYTIHTLAETGSIQNEIVVERSTDGGASWTPTVAHIATQGSRLSNALPSLAIDSSSGNLHAVWTDGSDVTTTRSTDGGRTWDGPVTVSTAPVKSAVMPWLAARDGKVAIVYYGSSGELLQDTRNEWDVYAATSPDSGTRWQQSRVTATPNHRGVICLDGDECAIQQRTLLDLFEVAIDPSTGKIGIAYTDDNHDGPDGQPGLPRIGFAFED